MKQVKLVFWLLVLAFVGLLFYQNREYFLIRHSLRLDLWFGAYTIPEVPNGLYFLACFLVGLLLAYFYQLPERFRSGKTIKHLNATIASLEADAANRDRSQMTPAPPSTAPTSPPAAVAETGAVAPDPPPKTDPVAAETDPAQKDT
jgi:hypothetical protein